eukprot:CAMPEP_0182855622 /NCGR_PEP_ID=MMETSP0034_2-20130328/1958_1 /TAXON_ID=156128 /ORGANISM="Nephroselmis pyriformis, Strain CCMP717" /LENGTH=377 /DNA_ID=CAMNT_0024986617 /DNA_START=63 /DNA_END=1193 /DNA_ORIENTATION=+
MADHPDELFPVTVEVCQKATSTEPKDNVRAAVHRALEGSSLVNQDGPLSFDDMYIIENVDSIHKVDTCLGLQHAPNVLLFWQMELTVLVYQLSEEEPAEETEGDEEIAMCREWTLPCRDFDGLWGSLIYDDGIKPRLLQYASTALLFSEKGVDTNLVSWNRVVLLHGPPGTGKTSLCKALAQKLTVRFSATYENGLLVEVNAHSLFSKWFSESGKMVAKLFGKIDEMVEEADTLVFILIDEVESLTAARKAAVSGAEPSDSIRVVNALLTHIDALKRHPNVMVFTTSNITQAIDEAFVDRADIKAYIGPPSTRARYEILRSCVEELFRAGVICGDLLQPGPPQSFALAAAAAAAAGGEGAADNGYFSVDHASGMERE